MSRGDAVVGYARVSRGAGTSLLGGSGTDRLIEGDGADTLKGGGGSDKLSAGPAPTC